MQLHYFHMSREINKECFGPQLSFFVFLQKQLAEQREMRLTAEKRLSALQTNMDKKREKEQKEMLGELKSALKEEIATLKLRVCETSSEG